MPHVYLTAHLFVPEEVFTKNLNMFKELEKESAREEGNIFYVATRRKDDKSALIFLEGWKSKEALTRHHNAPHFLRYVEFTKTHGLRSNVVFYSPALPENVDSEV